jgi:hypothetical protein
MTQKCVEPTVRPADSATQNSVNPTVRLCAVSRHTLRATPIPHEGRAKQRMCRNKVVHLILASVTRGELLVDVGGEPALDGLACSWMSQELRRRFASPVARTALRSIAARTDVSSPTTRTFFFARVTAV